MKDFLSKIKGNAGDKILNEREIQEKLYGKYRVPQKEKPPSEAVEIQNDSESVAPSLVQAEESRIASFSGSSFQSGAAESPKKISSNTFSSSTNYGRYSIDNAKRSKKFNSYANWLKNPLVLKCFGGLIVLVSVVLILQKVWIQLAEIRSRQQERLAHSDTLNSVAFPVTVAEHKIGNALESENSQRVPNEGEKLIEASRVAPTVESNESDLLGEQKSELNPFSIQVCTYRLESDAKKLVERLQGENFSAFYQRAPSKRDRTSKFYLVYVERSATYQDAQGALARFRQSVVSKEFPDAYIRKL